MDPRSVRARNAARVALGSVRLSVGCVAVVAPGAFSRRLGAGPGTPALTYAVRVFGVRTVLIGLELLGPDAAARTRALRIAPLIHASDTAAALLAGASRSLPPRAAGKAALVSATNLVLALVARPPSD